MTRLLLFGMLLIATTAQAQQAPGTITDWSLSRVYPAERVPREQYPHFYSIFLAQWRPVTAEVSGLLDITQHVQPMSEGRGLVLARSVFRSDQARDVQLAFGCSGPVDLFVNGAKVFSSDSSSLDVMESSNSVEVRFEQGLNEIFMMVAEGADGWGFVMRAEPPLFPKVRDHTRLTKLWETDQVFLTSESVLYDPDREVLYVTSFDNQFAQREENTGYVSKLNLDGEVLEHRWVSGLHAPTGMVIWRDQLFLTEREALVAVDLETGQIANRWPIPDADFPNDVAVDGDGNIYISDTRPSNLYDSRIYRFTNGTFEVWANEGISRANGLRVVGDYLIVGNSGDGFLKRVRLSDGRIENIISLGAGIIDGIRVDGEGNYLVSHWEGQAYRITPDGAVVEILDTMAEQRNAADFEFIAERNLLIIPTFLDNRVVAYRLNDGPADR